MFISSGLLNILCGADGPGLQKGMEYISRRHILVKYISKYPGEIYLKISWWNISQNILVKYIQKYPGEMYLKIFASIFWDVLIKHLVQHL